MPLVDLLNAVMGRMKRASHSTQYFALGMQLPPWGAVMLERKKRKKREVIFWDSVYIRLLKIKLLDKY